MRLTEAQVKEAILSPDQDVRFAAVYYFAQSYSADPGIMPLAIRAIEQYGWKDAFEFYSFVANLRQTDETVPWLAGQIKKHGGNADEDELRYAYAATKGLIQADAVILERHQSEILNLYELEDEAKNVISERIAFRSESTEELWHDLEAFCQRSDKLNRVPDDFDLANNLVEALGRHPEFSESEIQAILNGEPADNWLELCAVRLAGELRLQEAIPSIVTLLDDADDSMFEEGHRALVKIGGDKVVEELARAYPAGSSDLRSLAANLFEHIHSDSSVETCLKLFETEEDQHIRCSLLQSVLINFSTDGIEPARQLILTTPLDIELLEVRRDLLTACKVIGERFPEIDAWTDDAKNDMEFRRNWSKKLTSLDEFELDDEELDEPPPDTIVRHAHVGRNDPCPCGSGKKFKKCCLKKRSAAR